MIIKAILILLFVLIFFSLGSALFFLIRDKESSRVVKALTWRIGLSLVLFIILFMAYALGWIVPNQI